MLFEVLETLYFYLVCHFGGSFPDVWWKRAAALVTGICHHMLWACHAGHVYFDAWIWLSDESFALLQASLIVMAFVGLGAPLSWKK